MTTKNWHKELNEHLEQMKARERAIMLQWPDMKAFQEHMKQEREACERMKEIYRRVNADRKILR